MARFSQAVAWLQGPARGCISHHSSLGFAAAINALLCQYSEGKVAARYVQTMSSQATTGVMLTAKQAELLLPLLPSLQAEARANERYSRLSTITGLDYWTGLLDY